MDRDVLCRLIHGHAETVVDEVKSYYFIVSGRIRVRSQSGGETEDPTGSGLGRVTG